MQELKAPEKITQKMTRDGLAEDNQNTGEVVPISARAKEIMPTSKDSGNVGAVGRVLNERENIKKKQARRQGKEAAAATTPDGKTPRLKFTDAERADPALSAHIKKADKAADKFDAAKAKAQAGAKKRMYYSDPAQQRISKLRFSDQEKPGKLINPLSRPAQEASLAAHNKVSSVEQDNAAVEGAHKAERAAEFTGRTAKRTVKSVRSKNALRSYRAAAKAEKKTINAGANALYKKALRDDPRLAGAGSVSKFFQKRTIKRQYAKEIRNARFATGAANTVRAKGAAVKTADRTKKAAAFIARHHRAILIAGAVILIVVLLFAALSSCSNMIAGGFNSIIGSSYTSEDGDITEADNSYTQLETALNSKISRIETDHPGYDEYRYNLDEIGHDPFELASYLTAKFQSYTPAMAAAEMQRLFERQYTLTLSPVTEVRYRTEQRTGYNIVTDPETGAVSTVPYTYTVEVPYNYYILNVTLKNKSISGVAAAGLNAEQQGMYAVYIETRGNKDYLFEDNVYVDRSRGAYTDYDVPPSALTDTRFAAMIREAEKYLGYPYVWGGSSPSTSFDCSGFVSWVLNHSGWSVGRQTAQSLFNKCAKIQPSEAKPGDLIFFQGTYNSATTVSHIGIYVGGGMMIHCGNPISYANITSSYWQQHFYAYGRLP